MRLKPRRKWTPALLGGEPIKIDDKVKDYRTEVDKLLVDVDPNHGPILWIGETLKLTLPWRIDGVLSPQVHSGFQDHERRKGLDRKSTRLNSSHQIISY